MRPRAVGVALPPLLLAVAGLLHPMTLTTATSARWTLLHVALIPLFPLLGVGLWWLLRSERGPVAAVARVATFVYACFYGALDTINGVAAGALVKHTAPERTAEVLTALRPVLGLGNTLAWVGSTAFLVSAVLTGVLALRRHGRPALPGAVLTGLAAVSFLDSHIYWPRGVLTMLVLAVGLGLLSRSDGPDLSRSRT